jgi:TonB-dependent SusC/RagA subfamily outer membrane receptor
MTAKFPGVWISRTADGALSIRIRGATSVQGSNEPLYIIDGTPIQPGPNGGLTGISPQDIASIQVLKDAAATTMYGVRGANGVIIIKTKVQPGERD